MIKLKKLCAFAAGLAFIFSMTGCDMIQKTAAAQRATVVAKFKGGTVTKGEVDDAMKVIIPQLKQQYANDNSQYTEALSQQKTTILTKLIDLKIEAQKGKEYKVSSDSNIKKEAQSEIDKIKDQYSTSFKQVIQQQGYTESSLLNEMMVYEYICKDVTATDKEIETYYNNNKSSYTEKANTTHLQHILVKTEDEAKKVKKRITDGENFETVAKEVSLDPGTKDKGGDLGEVTDNDSNYDQSFMAGAMALKDGQVSDPIQSSYGWHIIKCVKKTQYPVKKLEDVKDKVKEQVISSNKTKKWQNTIAKWEKEANIKKYESRL